jgi:hypothetical protein
VLKTDNITVAGSAILAVFPLTTITNPNKIIIYQVIVKRNGNTILTITDVIRNNQYKYIYNSISQNITVALTGVPNTAERTANTIHLYKMSDADKFTVSGGVITPTTQIDTTLTHTNLYAALSIGYYLIVVARDYNFHYPQLTIDY